MIPEYPSPGPWVILSTQPEMQSGVQGVRFERLSLGLEDTRYLELELGVECFGKEVVIKHEPSKPDRQLEYESTQSTGQGEYTVPKHQPDHKEGAAPPGVGTSASGSPVSFSDVTVIAKQPHPRASLVHIPPAAWESTCVLSPSPMHPPS
jgi:hypothetical protein